jgi:hypothetical protein
MAAHVFSTSFSQPPKKLQERVTNSYNLHQFKFIIKHLPEIGVDQLLPTSNIFSWKIPMDYGFVYLLGCSRRLPGDVGLPTSPGFGQVLQDGARLVFDRKKMGKSMGNPWGSHRSMEIHGDKPIIGKIHWENQWKPWKIHGEIHWEILGLKGTVTGNLCFPQST